MSELAVKRDRIFKMYEKMCGRKPDKVVEDLLNVLMRDEMRPLVRDLIREYNRAEIVEKAHGIGGQRMRLSDYDSPYGTFDETEFVGGWPTPQAEIHGGFSPNSSQSALFNMDQL